MGFDDEVDSARERLRRAMHEQEPAFDARDVLKTLKPALERRIQSRRLTFAYSDEPGEDPAIVITHLISGDELGYILADENELVFESALDEYFDDFVDDDPESFVARLYETLRADIPKYELETGID